VVPLLSRTLHVASVCICLTVIASFLVFAVNQTSSASAHQQEVLNNEVPKQTAAVGGGSGARTSASHESPVHEAIDEASKAFTAPFDGITAGWSSEWLIRSANLGLALLLYGFALGYLARMIRVRL
jgi:hypothetical protein